MMPIGLLSGRNGAPVGQKWHTTVNPCGLGSWRRRRDWLGIDAKAGAGECLTQNADATRL